MIDATLGHIPYLSGSFGGGRFVQTVLIEDMSHCYDIFGLHHVYVGCHTRPYPSNFTFNIFRSDVQTSSSTYQAFRLRLHMDQTLIRLRHIRRSDFALIWIRCLHLICITFASTAVRRSDFVFCISGVSTSPSYGSDVQTSSVLHLLAPQSDVQTSSSAYQTFRLRLHVDQMFRLHMYHIF